MTFTFKIGEAKSEAPADFATMSRLGILEKGGLNRLRSFKNFYGIYYGDDVINRKPVAFEFEVAQITSAVYHPSILEIHNAGAFEQIKMTHNGQEYTHQVMTDTSFAQVDPLSSGEGFTIRSWKNLDGKPTKVNGLYETPTDEPLSEVKFEKPATATGSNELYLYFTENFGVASSYQYAEHHVYDASTDKLVVTTYADHHVGQTNQIIKRETIDYTRVANAKVWDYSLTRIVEEAANDTSGNIGALKVVSRTKETFKDFSASATGGEFGMRRMVEMIRDFGTGSGAENLTTTYTYYEDPSNSLVHGRLKSVEYPKGSWIYYEVTDGSNNPSPQTVVYSSYLDVLIGNKENARKVVTDYQTGSVTQTTYLAGVQVAKSVTSTNKESNGDMTLTEKQWTGTEWATTETRYHVHQGVGVQNGRRAWRKHADGTATRWSYSGTHDALMITEETGAGDENGITAGTRTVTNYNAAYQPIDVQVYDIQSGEVISSRTTIGVSGGAVDPQGRHTKWKYFEGANAYFTTTQYGCCGPEMTIDRSGATTTYYRDALRRIYKTTQNRSLSGSLVTTTTVTDGLTTTTNRSHGSTTLFVGGNTRSLSGLSVTSQSPDADGDGTPETTKQVTDLTSVDGPTTTTTYPDLTTTKMVSFLDGQIKESTDQENKTTTHTYSTHSEQGGGRIAAVNLPGSSESTTTYADQLGRAFKMVYADNAETIQAYFSFGGTVPAGSRGKLLSTTDPDLVTMTYGYNDEGERTTTKTPLPNDAGGNAQERETFSETNVITSVVLHGTTIAPAFETISKVNGVTTNKTYRSIDGRVSGNLSFGRESLAVTTVPSDGAWTATSTSPEGVQSRAFYEDGLMVASVSFENGTSLPVASPVNITAVNDAGFITGQSVSRDAFGRVLTQDDARTGTTTMGTYLDNGSLLSVTAPGDVNGSRTTTFTYDVMGRRLTVNAPDTSGPNGVNYSNITSTSYTDRGQAKAIWGAQTYPRRYEYDAQGRMVKLHTYQTQPTGEPTAAGDAVTQWIYHDQRGWLVEKNYHGESDTGADSGPNADADYTYTDAGRLQTRTWERGVVTTYGYEQGLLTSVTYSGETNGHSTPDLAYQYDNFGRMTHVYRGTDLTTLDPAELHASYTYDAATLVLTQEYLNQDLPVARYLTREYQDGSNNTVNLRSSGFIVSQTPQPSTAEHSVTYTYDTAGRLSTVASSFSDVHTYGYQPKSGNLIQSVTSPVHAVTNTWETDRNILQKKESKAGAIQISSYVYNVNAIGQRVGAEVMLPNVPGRSSANQPQFLRYNYNSRGEVIYGEVEDQDGDINDVYLYQYDAIGNREKSASGGSSTSLPTNNNYVFNTQNQYTTVPDGSTSFQYDDDGNAEQYPLPVDLSANSTLLWDAENRLVKATLYNNTVIDYDYDYLGRRIAKTTGGASTYYLYDGWNCIVEYNGSTLHKTYTWGLDLSGSLQGAGGVGGLLAVNDHTLSTLSRHYPTYDGNGNVSEYLNEIGAIVAHFEYDPFGNTTASSGSIADFDIRFSTKKQDAETGFYYYGYRYYDPNVGRWINRDPIEEDGGLNLYGFVNNNGIDNIDLLGEEVIIIRVLSSAEKRKGTPQNTKWEEEKAGYQKILDSGIKRLKNFVATTPPQDRWSRDKWKWALNEGKVSKKFPITGTDRQKIIDIATQEQKSRIVEVKKGGLKEVQAAITKATQGAGEYAKIGVVAHGFGGGLKMPDGSNISHKTFTPIMTKLGGEIPTMLVSCGQDPGLCENLWIEPRANGEHKAVPCASKLRLFGLTKDVGKFVDRKFSVDHNVDIFGKRTEKK